MSDEEGAFWRPIERVASRRPTYRAKPWFDCKLFMLRSGNQPWLYDTHGGWRCSRMPMNADQVTIRPATAQTVSGLLLVPAHAFACYVLAHGAGAGMTHNFMTAVAEGLHQRGVATLRYQFPYMQNGSKRPDRPVLAHATVRAAVAAAASLVPTLPLIAGGKSFGGRMTSQAQAEAPLPEVAGLAFIGFPLHPAGKPSDDRADHLSEVRIPMLFLQGTADALADSRLLAAVLDRLSDRATSHLIEHADHSFHVPKQSGTTDRQVLDELLDALAGWARQVCRGKTSADAGGSARPVVR